MKYLSIILLALFIVTADASAVVIDKKYDDQRYIEYGEKFNNVLKIETGSTFSSGVLLNNNWILTTKHSIEYKKDINIIFNGQSYNPIEIIKNKNSDVALLKVEIPEFKNKTELYIGDLKIDQECTIVGYGKTGDGQVGSIKYDFKKRAANNKIFGTMDDLVFCKFDPTSNIELNGISAVGDSGGGLFLKTGELIGINSIVKSPSDNKPDSDFDDISGHVKMSSIYDWIIENTNH